MDHAWKYIDSKICVRSKLPIKIMELLVETEQLHGQETFLWLVNQELVLRSEANYLWGMKSLEKGVRGKQYGTQGASKGKEQGWRGIESENTQSAGDPNGDFWKIWCTRPFLL